MQLPEKQRWLVTCEGAFSYLARDLSLKELFIWPMNADEVGTPKQIKKELIELTKIKFQSFFVKVLVNQVRAKNCKRNRSKIWWYSLC